MSKLNDISKSSNIMDIEIEYNDETIKFNLYEELQIKEITLNRDLKSQPAIYSFICMLHKKLLALQSEKQNQMEKAFARAYIECKSDIDSNTNRPYSNDVAKERAILNVKYQKLLKSYNDITDKVHTLSVCVKSFEQKAFLIQTISANLRKES